MKRTFLSTIFVAAAFVVLPGATWAEDQSTVSAATPLGTGEAGNAATGALESGGTFGGQNQTGPVSGGVMVRDGKAYIIHRLQTEMSLPDGSKVQPNGTIEEKDGSLRQVGENQMLSLDGRMLASPFRPDSKADEVQGSSSTESSPAGIPGRSSPGTDGSTTSLGTSTDLSRSPTSLNTETTAPARPRENTSDPFAPSSNQPFTPDSISTAPTNRTNPLESTSPGGGLQDTSPLQPEPKTSPATKSSTTEPYRESNSVPQQPGNISTDPTRDRLN